MLRPIVEGLKKLGSYSVAEVDHQDEWQRATLGLAIVSPDGVGLNMHINKIRRYLDSRLEVEVLDVFIAELEEPE